jgi:acetyl-CoA carboxylase carboxyltransferase component
VTAGDWGPLLDELGRRRAAAQAMGGPEKLARQHGKGRLDARQRLDRLFDPGTFVELGALVGSLDPDTPADGLVAGLGDVDGRPVLAGAEDFTVKGGSIGVGNTDKRFRLTQLADQERVPLVLMLDGAGHRMAPETAGRRPNDLQGLADLKGRVPLVTLVLGPAAGHSALAAPLADHSVMTEGAALFAAGPVLVKPATGEDVTPEDLGGPEVALPSGVVHDVVPDDGAAIDRARAWLSYFGNDPAGSDTGPRRLDDLLEVVPPDPRQPYPIGEVIDRLVDDGSLLVVQPRFGEALVTALARLGGRAVAIVANDPAVRAGAIGRDEAHKAARFLDTVGPFGLPVVFLADNPGVMAGTTAEREGVLRAAAEMFTAQRRLRSSKLHVTLRKAFGFGSSVMAMNPFDGQTLTLALPGVTLAAMPADGVAEAGPYRSAHSMGYDDVIDPRDLRDALLTGLRLAR